MATVKSPRRYDSTNRRRQAERNRSEILRAARRIFLERGYADTTIAAIAQDAGVSTETVYKAFRNKPGLLKAVVDVAIIGDEQPIPMLQRELVQRIESEPDRYRKLALYEQHLAASSPRRAPLELLAKAAAASDRGAAEVWDSLQQERLIGMSRFADHLHRARVLRPGVSKQHARDVLWTYIAAELYDLLVLQRGWSVKRYARWTVDAIGAALFAPT